MDVRCLPFRVHRRVATHNENDNENDNEKAMLPLPKRPIAYIIGLVSFYIYPIRLLMLCEDGRSEQGDGDGALLDVAVAIFAHIKVGGIGALLATLEGKAGERHRVVGLQDEGSLGILTQGTTHGFVLALEPHGSRVVHQGELLKAVVAHPPRTDVEDVALERYLHLVHLLLVCLTTESVGARHLAICGREGCRDAHLGILGAYGGPAQLSLGQIVARHMLTYL